MVGRLDPVSAPAALVRLCGACHETIPDSARVVSWQGLTVCPECSRTAVPEILAAPTFDPSDLTYDGAETETSDGRTVRLSVEPDTDHSLEDDGDWYGRIEWARGDHRPDGFTGAAEVLDRDWHGRLWWEPPADLRSDRERRRELRATVSDIIHYGFSVIGVTVIGTDGAERSAYCGGFVPFPSSEDLIFAATDLATEASTSVSPEVRP
jgi:hypothetical protein